MPKIKCCAIDCLHHNGIDSCDIKIDCTIDISSNGICLDYSPITDDEFKTITGYDRIIKPN